MLHKVLGRIRLTLKAIMLDSMRQGRHSRGRRNSAHLRTNLASILGGFSTAVGNRRRSLPRRTAACESLEFRALLTTWNIGSEAIHPGSVDQFTTIYPTDDNGTGADIEIFWGGDHSGFSDSYYYFDANGGTGGFSQVLGTNPFIKFIGSTGDDIVRNNSGNGGGIAVELTAYGHGGNDEFYGGQEYDKLFGGPGNDTLYGYDGDDVLYGGDATDNDELYGGTGEDRFYVANDGTNSGKDQVRDKRGHDSRIHFVDTTVSEVEFGVTWSPKAWTDSEIEVFDVVLEDFHDTTGNERLNQESNEGGDLYFRRLGTNSGGTQTAAWSNAIDTSTYPDSTFAGGDPQTKIFVAHEVLGHNYDRPTTNAFATAFQAISGWTQTAPPSSISYAAWTAANPGFVKSNKDPHNGWYFNPGNNTKATLFARDYGASSPFEDFATTAEAWYASEFSNNQPAWFNPLVASKQANLQLLFDDLKRPTTPANLEINQTVINRPVFTWDTLVADSFRVQIKDASNNVVRDDTTLDFSMQVATALPAGRYTFLVSSTTIEEQESSMASVDFIVNHAPVWAAGVQPPRLANQNEDDRLAYGTTVLSLTAAASDVDASAKKGIAIFSAPTAIGVWQFTINGGSSWSTLPATSRSNARLLPANGTLSRVRFVPNPNVNGSVQLGYFAWDQTQGTVGGSFDISTSNRLGGTTAFSAGIHNTSLTVSPINDAPVWATGVQPPRLANQNEDDRLAYGTTIVSLTAAASDVDAGATKGIAIFSAPTAMGVWQFTINGGSSWSTLPATSRSNARLLPANGTLSRIRFVPNPNVNGSVQLGYFAWDQTQGTVGGSFDVSTSNRLGGTTAFSAGIHNTSLTVSPLNDAPVWATGTPAAALIGINEDDFASSGTSIASLTSGMTDVDAGAMKGIAVYYTSSLESGHWQFTTDGGVRWNTFASLGFPRERTNALLLPVNGNLSRVRFVPKRDYNGNVQLGYFAWDQTQGTVGRNFDIAASNKLGGMTAFSTRSHISTLTVRGVNDAPVWATGPAAALIGIDEDNLTSLGTTIESITAGVRDVDASALKGIAIFSAPLPNGAGRWQYTLNGGNTWVQFASPSSPFGRSNALLLPANGNLSRVRFVPFKDFNGAVRLGYFAWDQTQGTAGGRFDISTDNKLGGTTAFSTGIHNTSLTVSPLNDAPVWATGVQPPPMARQNEDDRLAYGTTVASLTAAASDVDAGAKKGIAIFSAPTAMGVWQFTINGGSSWSTLPATSRSNARLLPANGTLSRVRFVPNPNVNGSVQLGYFAWDQTQGTVGGSFDISTSNRLGGNTAFSAGIHNTSLTVSPVNDAPQWLTGPPTMAVQNEDDRLAFGTTVASLTAATTDVDAGAKKGIAIFSAPTVNGVWQFTINGGSTWTTLPATSRSNARLLAANGTLSRIRFVPNRDFNGRVQLGYYAWDQTQGTPGGTFNIATDDKLGGTTAFSTGIHFPLLTVSPVPG